MIEFKAPEGFIRRKSFERVTDKIRYDLDLKDRKIILLLEKNPSYTSTELAEKLCVSRKTISHHLSSLKERGIVSRVGSDRKGYWLVNDLE